MSSSGSDDRTETRIERSDRNFVEAVQELRVAQTGVQVLFAFLLSLPFLSSFPSQDRTFVTVYTSAFLCAGGAALAFIAPVAFHRLHFRQGRKEGVVLLTHAVSLLGLVLLTTAMVLSVWLLVAFLWSTTWALVIAGSLLLFVVVLWIALPWWMLTRQRWPDADV